MLRPRALFEENFCGWRTSSDHTEREVQLRMFASYRSLEPALLFSIYTNKQFKALNSLDTYSWMVSGFVTSVQRKEIAGEIVVAKVRNSQRMNDPLLDHCRKCPSQLSSGKIFWKLLTMKQQTGRQDLTMVHLV